MPAKITLTVAKGQLQGQEFVFDDRTTCIIGRADDCQPRLPDDKDHKTISRHHCLLDLNPPDARIRDFGSLNGTYVNGAKIGQRGKGQTPDAVDHTKFLEHDLKEGDEILLGSTVFRVGVFVPTLCAGCGCEIAEGQKGDAHRSTGIFQCEKCQVKAAQAKQPAPPRKQEKVCAKCSKDVAREIGEQRQGDYVCAACKADPVAILKQLLEMARIGDRDLLAIQGYEIVRELGKGGMGAVYLARHELTREQVALKVMLPKIAADERARSMFLREADNTKALKHPHVVELKDAGCSQGTFFFTLAFCDGGSVDWLMDQRGGPLPITEAAPIIVDTLMGLEYAHAAPIPCARRADGSYTTGTGLVHRDLKPQNIFLSGHGPSRIAKVGDFGLAKAFDMAGLSAMTRTGSAAGTPVFMPRQQVVNFKYAKPEVDVWAAAASLYFMLTARPPREFPKGRDPWQIVLQTDPVPIRQRDQKIPVRLADVLDQALRDKPAIIFKTAADFRRALERVL